MTICCPLNGSKDIELIEEIKTVDLIKMYCRAFGVDVTEEFGNLVSIGFYRCRVCDLRFFSPMVTGSEQFYRAMYKFDWYYLEEKDEYEFACKFIKESDLILDIGCGKGAFALKVPTKQYIGLEFNQEAIELAINQGITVLNESIEQHAQANLGQYDVVCAFQVLEHVAELRSFIESSFSCLKPGGFLIYSIPSVESFSRYVPNPILDMPPHHVTRWSDKTIEKIGEYFSLEVIDIWHEPLQVVHKEFYAQTVFTNAFFTMLKREIKNIDRHFTTKFVVVLSRLLGRIFAHGLTHADLLPRGISVAAVYRKPRKED